MPIVAQAVHALPFIVARDNRMLESLLQSAHRHLGCGIRAHNVAERVGFFCDESYTIPKLFVFIRRGLPKLTGEIWGGHVWLF